MELTDRFTAMWQERDSQLAHALFTADYCGFDMTTNTHSQGPAGAAARLEKVFRVFPDLEFHVEQAVFDHERLALHWRVRGTHSGIFMNIPPTGQRVEINGISFLTLRGDKVCQAFHMWDMAAMLRTLGLLPELEPQTFPEAFSFHADTAMRW